MAMTPSKLKEASYVRNIFVATPEAGTTLEDVQDPAFWTHVAKQLRISDRIEVIPEDSAFFAELYVQNVRLNTVNVKLLRHNIFAEAEDEAKDELHDIKWRGPLAKFRVTRKKDNATLKEGFESKADARQWLATYELGLSE